jgi:hypothetical protein
MSNLLPGRPFAGGTPASDGRDRKNLRDIGGGDGRSEWKGLGGVGSSLFLGDGGWAASICLKRSKSFY